VFGLVTTASLFSTDSNDPFAMWVWPLRNVNMNNVLGQVFKLLPAQRRARLSLSCLLAVQ